jgi:prolyl 4-hydroxylase
MKTEFNTDWKTWINTNVENGQDKNRLFKILLDEGFTYQSIREEMQFEPTIKTEFNAAWQAWIKTNVDDGQDKNGLFKILLDEGFSYQSIHEEMQFEPSLPVDELINPLKAKEKEQNAQTAVDLNQLFVPNGQKLDSDALQLFTVENFLNVSECKAIAAEIKQALTATALNNADTGHGFHQGGVCDLSANNNPFIEEIDQRLSKLIGIDVSYSEPLQGQYYGADQTLKPYTDYLEEHEMDHYDELMGHRTYTVMIYLNDTESGGGTHFSEPNCTIKPRTGLAVIWSNLDPDGLPKSKSVRNTMPVVQGYQTVITKWFRSKSRLADQPPMFIRDVNELIPAYTEAGFAKSKLPARLFSKIQAFYHANRDAAKEETVPGDFIVNTAKSKAKGSSLIDLSTALRAEIHDNLKASMERWSGKELLPTYVYGIRIYHRGAILKCHRDRLATHIIGAIINIDQEVEEDWVLVIDDHHHRRHQITLKPGEMIFYESSRLIHGRPTAFKGDLFANIFCHFKPTDYVPRNLTQDT